MQVTETFAFIDLGSGDRGLADCIAGLNNTKWKGKVVRKDWEPFSFTIRLFLPDEAAASEGEFHGETCQGEEGEGIRRLDPFLIQ